jgi:hypothetical protein
MFSLRTSPSFMPRHPAKTKAVNINISNEIFTQGTLIPSLDNPTDASLVFEGLLAWASANKLLVRKPR